MAGNFNNARTHFCRGALTLIKTAPLPSRHWCSSDRASQGLATLRGAQTHVIMDSITDLILQALREQDIDTTKRGTRIRVRVSENKTKDLFCTVTKDEADIYDRYIFTERFRLVLEPRVLRGSKDKVVWHSS